MLNHNLPTPTVVPVTTPPCTCQQVMQDIQNDLRSISTQLNVLLRHAQPSAPQELATIQEAAQLLGISERAIRGRLARKQWPVYRCGRAVRVDPQEIKTLMKSSSQVTPHRKRG